MEPSPYLPVTRRYVNPLYLRVELIPEFAYLPAEQLTQITRDAQALALELNTDQQLDRNTSWKHKRDALLDLLEQLVQEPFFDDLRTQQQVNTPQPRFVLRHQAVL